MTASESSEETIGAGERCELQRWMYGAGLGCGNPPSQLVETTIDGVPVRLTLCEFDAGWVKGWDAANSTIGMNPVFGKDWLHPCALHLGELEIDTSEENGYPPGCPECGCLIDSESCLWCGAEWIAFGEWSGDDIIRPAGITLDGDFMCANCAQEVEEEMSEEFSEDWEFDYP